MKRQAAIVILAFILVSSFGIEKAFAGAWTVPKHRVWGEYYMKWNYGREEFTSEWDRRVLSAAEKNARSWEFVMEPKIEYGITDWLNFLASIEYKEAHYKEYGRQPSLGPYARKNHGITNV
ncbi:MAG: hypothetical protein HZA30_03675, partial [Candidatus Omnitrophica bacterium]|nr:hypothetical protein [Candidatus Omnitrophota bacterium]